MKRSIFTGSARLFDRIKESHFERHLKRRERELDKEREQSPEFNDDLSKRIDCVFNLLQSRLVTKKTERRS